MCRHFLRNLKWIRPISGAKNWRQALPSAARVRPASAPFPSFASLRTPTGATTNDLTPCRMPLVLSAPPLALRLRQNKRPYGYAGVVVHRSSTAAPSTSMYSFDVFREFLKRLMSGATRPVILVVDGHPAHKSKWVKGYVEQQEGRLTLAYLPPYSPQLNPDEQVWSWINPGWRNGFP